MQQVESVGVITSHASRGAPSGEIWLGAIVELDLDSPLWQWTCTGRHLKPASGLGFNTAKETTQGVTHNIHVLCSVAGTENADVFDKLAVTVI